MQTAAIDNLLVLLTPVFSGLFCIILVSLRFPVWEKLKGSGLRGTLALYYALICFTWAMSAFNAYRPHDFVYYRIFLILAGMLVPVVLYRFLFILTRTDELERFSPLHFIFPVAVFLVYGIWSLAVPREVFLGTSLYLERSVEGYEGFYTLLKAGYPLRTAVGIVYSSLSILRYRRYRRFMADYSSELREASLYWVQIFLILWISFLVVPLLTVRFPYKSLFTQLRLIIPALIIFFQHIILCFNAIRGNYVFIRKTDAKEAAKSAVPEKTEIAVLDFKRYIEQRKPYLNPGLTIAELATGLNTNRTYLSAFINQAYGMNFSQFINECRLLELDRIVADPAKSHYSNSEKISLAGFGSYDSYRRAMKLHEKRKLLSNK